MESSKNATFTEFPHVRSITLPHLLIIIIKKS